MKINMDKLKEIAKSIGIELDEKDVEEFGKPLMMRYAIQSYVFKHTAKPERFPPNFISRLMGKPATFMLLNGTSLTGTVKGYNNYDILIDEVGGVDSTGPLLLPKHSILYIQSDNLVKAKKDEAQ